MEDTNLDASGEWGMTYLTKTGVSKVISNLDEVPADWVIRFYYKDNNGYNFLKRKEGRELCVDISPQLSNFEAKKYIHSIPETIEDLEDIRKDLKHVKKMLSKGLLT